MRILFVTQNPPGSTSGGIEIYTASLANELKKHGHEVARHKVSFFARESREDSPEYELRKFTADGIEVTALNRFPGNEVDFEEKYINRKAEAAFQEHITKDRPDLVHIHHLGGLSHTFKDVLAKENIPFVITLHDFTLICPRGQLIADDLKICLPDDMKKCAACIKPHTQHTTNPFLKLYSWVFSSQKGLEQMIRYRDSGISLMKSASAVLAPSEFVRQKAIELGIESSKAFTMPYGYDLPVFHELREAASQSGSEARKFIFAGSLIPSKGVHVLIEAFKIALKQLTEPEISLKLIGPAPQYHGKKGYLEKLERAAKGLNVEFMGEMAHSELLHQMADADVLVMPSLWWETHGIVLREARLLGLAAIVSGHGALAEVASQLGGALAFKPGDPSSLADKIALIASDDELYRDLKQQECRVKTIEEDSSDHSRLYGSLL